MKNLSKAFPTTAILLMALVALAPSVATAQTPDGFPPANEGACDDLKFATPGLYGLCIAFCEAQDCEPDWSAPDPLAKCRPSSAKLLDRFNAKKQPGDPGMPQVCLQGPCPCWSQEEIDDLRYPIATDSMDCGSDFWAFSAGGNYGTFVIANDNSPGGGGFCFISDRCNPAHAPCLQTIRSHSLTPGEASTCVSQMEAAATDRGFSCFTP